VSAAGLRGLPLPVARRLLRRAIQEAKGDLRRIEFVHVEAILRLAEEKEGHGRVQIPEVDVLRSFDWLRLAPLVELGEPARNYRLPLPVPGFIDEPGGSVRLYAVLSDWEEKIRGLDWDRLPRPLELRNWRPGDQYRPLGRERAERIKTLFQLHKVPLWERRTWPVVTGGEIILWSRRFGPAADYAAVSGTRQVLKIEETGHDSLP
jgi:tRNA(Ile)-lysidine synthase